MYIYIQTLSIILINFSVPQCQILTKLSSHPMTKQGENNISHLASHACVTLCA